MQFGMIAEHRTAAYMRYVRSEAQASAQNVPKRSSDLTLGELALLAGPLEPKLLALLLTRIA